MRARVAGSDLAGARHPAWRLSIRWSGETASMKDASFLRDFVPEFRQLSISDVHRALGNAWQWTREELSKSEMYELRSYAEAHGFTVDVMSDGTTWPRLRLPMPGSGTAAYCVRLAPAFHERGHILATFGRGGGAVSIVRESGREETAEVPDELGLRFLDEVAALDPLRIPNGSTCVIADGMSLECLVQEGRVNHRFFGDSPDPAIDPRQRGFAAALCRLAMDLAREPGTQLFLERVLVSDDRGLPVRVFEETPRRIRIFGGLTSSEAEALEALFASVAPGEPVVMDLSNFQGMGEALYPHFARFHARTGRTAWWARGFAVRQLIAAGIPRDLLFPDLASARAALRDGAAL